METTHPERWIRVREKVSILETMHEDGGGGKEMLYWSLSSSGVSFSIMLYAWKDPPTVTAHFTKIKPLGSLHGHYRVHEINSYLVEAGQPTLINASSKSSSTTEWKTFKIQW